MEPQKPTKPTTEVTWDQFQKPTTVKPKIQGAVDFLKSEGITGKNEAVFEPTVCRMQLDTEYYDQVIRAH